LFNSSLIGRFLAAHIFMNDISACNGIKEKNKCPQRQNCKRHEAHLSAASKQQSYIKAAFVDNSCEFFKEK